MSLETIGSIATHIAESFVLPVGISGNLVETVDANRILVENFTGDNIGSNSISEKYQHAILNYSKADVIDMTFAQGTTVSISGTSNVVEGNTSSFETLRLEGLEVSEGKGGAVISVSQALGGLSKDSSKLLRQMADNSLKYIGRKVRFGKTLV